MFSNAKFFEKVWAANQRKQFVPFTFVLKNGKRYDIRKWGEVAMAQGNPTVVVLVDEGQSFDPFTWNDVADVIFYEPAI